MKDISISELITLIAADLDDPEERVEKMFDWYIDRSKVTVQWILGGAASLFLAVLVAFSRNELSLPWWQTGLVALFALGTGSYGLLRLRALGGAAQQYVAAIAICARLKQIRRFLAAHRG